jgi:hypothetical protein
VGVFDEVSPQRARHGLAREVVVRRAQAAADDEHVGLAGEQEAQVGDEGVEVVGRRQKVRDARPARRQRGGEVGSVAVAQAPVEQLAATEEDGCPRAR